MTDTEAYAQGARCGHIEGKNRVGQYVLDEEYLPSWEAAENQGLHSSVTVEVWARGYRFGYKLAAEGNPLPGDFLT